MVTARTRSPIECVSHERLLHILRYEPSTGVFYCRISRGAARMGSIAGYLREDGYIGLSIDSKLYMAHRTAWFYMTGAWPNEEIDHKNRIRIDNRWCNLREASSHQNHCNRPQIGKTCDFQGIRWDAERGKWLARVAVQRKYVLCKRFLTLEEAVAARAQAVKQFHGEFAIEAS